MGGDLLLYAAAAGSGGPSTYYETVSLSTKASQSETSNLTFSETVSLLSKAAEKDSSNLTFYETVSLLSKALDSFIAGTGGASYYETVALTGTEKNLMQDLVHYYETMSLNGNEKIFTQSLAHFNESVTLSTEEKNLIQSLSVYYESITLTGEDNSILRFLTPYFSTLALSCLQKFTASIRSYPIPIFGNQPPVQPPAHRQGGGNPGLNSIGYAPMLMNAVQTNLSVTNSSNQSFTASSDQKILFQTITNDPLSEWNASSSIWTAQQSGVYILRNNLSFTTLPASFSYTWKVYVNGVVKSAITEVTQDFDSSIVLSLTAGDTVDFYINPNAAVTLSTGAFATIVRTR